MAGAISFASGRGAHHEVAVLFGATNRINEELGSVREEFEQSMVLRDTEKSRAALGEIAFTADVVRGEAISLEEAANAALRALEEQS